MPCLGVEILPNSQVLIDVVDVVDVVGGGVPSPLRFSHAALILLVVGLQQVCAAL